MYGVGQTMEIPGNVIDRRADKYQSPVSSNYLDHASWACLIRSERRRTTKFRRQADDEVEPEGPATLATVISTVEARRAIFVGHEVLFKSPRWLVSVPRA